MMEKNLLSKLCDWFAANKLTLNTDKTNHIVFHPPRKKEKNPSEYDSLLQTKIKRVDWVTYLRTFT